MTALLINDVVNEKSASNPKNQLDHPMQLLQKTQVHGGMYRNGLGFESMSIPAFLAALINKFWWVALLACAAGAGLYNHFFGSSETVAEVVETVADTLNEAD